jgi:hypothetical protein
MEEPVSSLYGPGAIICWLCTALSVLLSWGFNHSSRKYDTFTTDVLACLLLPAIAIIHLVYELSHTTKTKDGKATPLMDATFAICMNFAQLGPTLCFLAFSHHHKRKFVLTTAVTVACWVMELVVFASNNSNIPRFDKQNVMLPIVMGGCICIFFCMRSILEQSRRASAHYRSPSTQSIVWCIPFWFVPFLVYGLCFSLYFCGDGSCKEYDSDGNKRPQVKERWLPQTPYSIGDIDQAVALSVGIVTLLLSIRDIIQDFNFPIDDEFEYWRIRCVRSIESGDTKVEVARWKQSLEALDKMSKCERTRARHRKRELETYKNMPKGVKDALDAFKISRMLTESGFL